MHASVIEAREYRIRENQRRADNIAKRQRNGIVRALGAEPALMPCFLSGGNHRQRRIASRPMRQERRATTFCKNLGRIILVV